MSTCLLFDSWIGLSFSLVATLLRFPMKRAAFS
jgi:hypothetical protein